MGWVFGIKFFMGVLKISFFYNFIFLNLFFSLFTYENVEEKIISLTRDRPTVGESSAQIQKHVAYSMLGPSPKVPEDSWGVRYHFPAAEYFNKNKAMTDKSCSSFDKVRLNVFYEIRAKNL